MIEFRDIRKTYGHGDAAYEALKGVSFTINDGEFVAIMGPSG
jgi:putative ABC transport system ATP-binding protein